MTNINNTLCSIKESFLVVLDSRNASTYNNGTYIQAPFEDITEERYNELMESLVNVDLTQVVELVDDTNLAGEIACGAAGCEVK